MVKEETISTGYFVKALLKEFEGTKGASRTAFAHQLYDTYKSDLSVPRMTPSKVSAVLAYMHKSNKKEKDLPKVIAKVVPTSNPAMSEKDFDRILAQVGYQGVTANKHKYALSKHDVLAIYDTVLDNIKKAVISGYSVRIAGLGTFKRIKRDARTYRNPQTGKPIKKPATYAIKFQPSAPFKRAVAKK